MAFTAFVVVKLSPSRNLNFMPGLRFTSQLQSIFLESGVLLLQCLVDAWNKQTKFERDSFHQVDVKGGVRNVDICGICGDGGRHNLL